MPHSYSLSPQAHSPRIKEKCIFHSRCDTEDGIGGVGSAISGAWINITWVNLSAICVHPNHVIPFIPVRAVGELQRAKWGLFIHLLFQT